jgi:phage terminase large subunit
LLGPARYKGAHGGRGSAKSHFFAELLIERCIMERTDWVCLREVQKTLDQSVKKLLESKIEKFGVSHLFDCQTNRIKTPFGGVIIFQGMQDHTSDSIKSLEGFDGAWFEEAQTMSPKSLELLRPTLRKPGSEIWFSWNPNLPTDAVDMFFRGDNPPPDSVVVEANYQDNPWFPAVLEQERVFDLSISPERHAHVWLGAYNQDGDNNLIPAAWVHAAFDAHVKLGFEPSGQKKAGLDVADEGMDKNAFCGRRGILLDHLEEWTGKGADIFSTVQRTFMLCDQIGYKEFDYDADGLGAGVRGDARIVNEARGVHDQIVVMPFRGSGEVLHPDREMVRGRKNKDFFANRKAQAWWDLRIRFQNTFRAVVEGMEVELDQIISIPSTLKQKAKLSQELSQPTWMLNGAGKVLIEKAPEGARSPNLADAVMICYAQTRPIMRISAETLQRAAR